MLAGLLSGVCPLLVEFPATALVEGEKHEVPSKLVLLLAEELANMWSIHCDSVGGHRYDSRCATAHAPFTYSRTPVMAFVVGAPAS